LKKNEVTATLGACHESKGLPEEFESKGRFATCCLRRIPFDSDAPRILVHDKLTIQNPEHADGTT
jgi:hypothetical protein